MAAKKAAAQPSSDESKPSEDVVVEAALEEKVEPAEAQLAESITPEESAKEETTEVTNDGKSVSVTDSTAPKFVYPTDFYRGNGIAHCSVCGEADRNDSEGTPICIENRSNCPRK